MATSATLSAGTLTIIGDTLDNSIVAGRDAAGNLLVNGGAVAIAGGPSTIANTTLVETFGQAGDDTIKIDETSGAMPAADLFGGAGNDTITAGSGSDQLFGQAGNDTLIGGAGNDQLFGGDDSDTLIAGSGSNQLFGEDGDDLMVWNPGGGSALFEGGNGNDTAQVNGGSGAETFSITANGTRVRFDRISPSPFSLDIGTTEHLVLHAGAGDDVITAGNGLAALIALTLDGGDGNDTITGGDGADLLIGGNGNDIITGGRGNDTAQLGDGDDTFIWNPGDGSDNVDGGAGFDTLIFNGANIAEHIDISANGSHAQFTRDVANIVMDLTGIEKIVFHALGGADTITVNDLTGTDVQQVAIDLAATAGGNTGDGAADTVVVNGTGSADHITVALNGSTMLVNGLPAQVSITGQEAANDTLKINGLGGDDVIDASALPATQIRLSIDGGAGNDTIIGSAGSDTIVGGDGNDTVTGGRGDDVALLGNDDDTFIWNPGDGSDTVEGQAGFDTLVFNGANVAEQINISANGSRVLFTRDVGNVTMDLNGIEKIVFHALGGADTVAVNDLTGTDALQVAIDLSAAGGGGDGSADTVIVNGTASSDHITVSQSAQGILVGGLAAQVSITGQEATDHLVVNGGASADVIDASALNAGQIGLTINGGDGADVILGSTGNDTITGGRDNDVAFMGAGDDTYIWNPGDGSDTVEGQAGFDTLQFNGANVSEHIDISANGSHALFTRDVANISMDLSSVEKITFHALGGADLITVNDLAGTDVQQVAIDLSANGGGGDGAADTVVVNAGGSADHIVITQSGSDILVNGLTAQVTVSGAEAANDTLQVNGLGGADIIDAFGLAIGHISLAIDGGAGDDVITGSRGNDLLSGGAGDDTFVFRPGASFDIVTDFTAGACTPDKIDLRAFSGFGINALSDVLGHATQMGADTVLDFGNSDVLLLRNVVKGDLSVDDFLFGPPPDLTPPHVTNLTASPGTGIETPGSVVHFTLSFDETVNVTDGVPALTLNDGGLAVYNAAASALLGDHSKLVFDYVVSPHDTATPALAVTGIGVFGSNFEDLAGNHADLSHVAATFNGLEVDIPSVPAPTVPAPAFPLLSAAGSLQAGGTSAQGLFDSAIPAFHADFHLV